MNFLKKLLLLFVALFLGVYEAWGMEEEDPPKKHVCLMNLPTEYSSLEWLQEFTDYIKQKGRQQQRLEDAGKYTRSFVRFVNDIPNLTVGYGLLSKDKKAEIPELELKEEAYQELAELGMAVKVINGYVQNFDESELTFTPTKTNIFIPHISYIIQWKEDTAPELASGGMLYDQQGRLMVFMSGAGVEETDTTIEQFYNHIYKEEKCPEIGMYSGNKVADKYVPHILFEAVETAKLPLFQGNYLGKISENMKSKFVYTKATQDKILLVKNTINITFQFLSFLFQNNIEEIFKNRQDTVRRLLDGFIKVKKIQIAEDENEKDKKFNKEEFIRVLKDNRLEFLQAALRRIKGQLHSLEDEDQTFLKNIISYMSYSLAPQKLKDLEEAKEFWEIIKVLEGNITCSNPDSQYSSRPITGTQRLKKYALQGFNGSHTEPLFIKLIRSDSQLLIQGLQKIINDHKDKFLDTLKPRFLGIVVDGFSWLDTCPSCGNYLHTNNLWGESLEEVNRSITLDETANYFVSPFIQIDSLFRILAQECYEGPSDISNAEGGKNYSASGWDYRVLSEMRYTLATRLPQKKGALLRDRIFERIPTSITRASIIKPIEFWQEHSALSQVVLAPVDRPFAINAIDILFLRFPEEKAIRIKKIVTARNNSKPEEVYQLARPLVSAPIIFNEDDKKFLDTLISEPKLSQTPGYLKTYFAEACLKRAKGFFKKKELNNGWIHVNDLANFGLLNNQQSIITSFEQVANHIITYWKTEWNEGKKRANWNSPQVSDVKNVKSVIKMFWKLAYKVKNYSFSLEDEQITELLEILEHSGIPKSDFVN